ncbi:glycosyltransferase [Candidatus Woesearchaeota archaeon]|nr:glycosyltransferase [Candidatus Woesearchaeota archaeon]
MKKYTIIFDSKTKISSKITPLKGKRDVSVVIPSYNEEGNVIRLIDRITKAIGKNYSFEVVIVDDASTDNTKKVLTKRALKDKNVVAVFREGIRGIWSAQLDGVKLCRGKTVVFMDADFSHPPEKIPELLKYIPEYDFVSASRYIGTGGMKGIPIKHYISTNMFNIGMKVIMGLKATDYTGVFHAIKKDRLMQILPKSNALAGEFDLDLLYYAKKKRLKFKEVPFTYVYRVEGNSKSRRMRKLAFVYGMRALKLRLFGSA